MRKGFSTIFLAVLSASASVAIASDQLLFNDGQSHTVTDGNIHTTEPNAVQVGSDNTILNIWSDETNISGGLKGIYVYGNGTVNVAGDDGSAAERIDIVVNYSNTYGTPANGLSGWTGGKVDLDAKEINIDINATALIFAAQGLYASGGSYFKVGSDSTSSISISASGVQGSGTGYGNSALISAIYAEGSSGSGEGSNIVLQGQAIDLTASATEGRAFTVFAQNGSTVSIGDENSEITLTANAKEKEGGAIFAHAGGAVTVTGTDLTLDSNGWYGIRAQNNTDNAKAPDGTASVIINASNTTINKHGYDTAIAAFSNGYVEINGNLTATSAPTLIDTRGNATVNINQSGTGTVVLAGDIVFETPGPDMQSGSKLNAYVNINLSNAASSWTGNVQKLYPESFKEEESFEEWTDVSGFNLTVANGAQWNVTPFVSAAPAGGIHESQAANKVALDGGIINSTEAGQSIDVEDLSLGAGGGTFNSAVKVNDDGSISAAKIAADSVKASNSAATLSVNYNISSDFISEANASALAGIEAGTVGEGIQIVEYAPEGDIHGAWTRENGEGAGQFAANPKLEAFRGVTAVSLVQWRNQVNHLTKRLGDVRQQPGDIGAWARVYGGEYKWGDANRVDMTTTTVQAGGDARVGDWIVGGAFSYSDSSYDIERGDGDGELYSLALYGSRLFEKGSYVDFVARYGYIKNDMEAGNMALDFASNAFGLSVETGHTFKLIEHAYVEPQLELAYGYAKGDDARASNGVKIELDDYQSLVARVGFRTGFDFPEEAGTIYAHASYSYDFLGDADATASNNVASTRLDEDLGGGWVTYGIGGQFRLGENTVAYGELERTTGGDVENPWAFNIGIRHLF